ncbi:hypothetical protein HZH68_009868 [Vespula germanica]|uniref:Uncharacterized protein n=1 Tax=Vespula germanica TaxID=30212 RepID=A0A834JWE9_VESGE|nr:hypothetical protein HZH68_009868 [Vespula germanica]
MPPELRAYGAKEHERDKDGWRERDSILHQGGNTTQCLRLAYPKRKNNRSISNYSISGLVVKIAVIANIEETLVDQGVGGLFNRLLIGNVSWSLLEGEASARTVRQMATGQRNLLLHRTSPIGKITFPFLSCQNCSSYFEGISKGLRYSQIDEGTFALYFAPILTAKLFQSTIGQDVFQNTQTNPKKSPDFGFSKQVEKDNEKEEKGRIVT